LDALIEQLLLILKGATIQIRNAFSTKMSMLKQDEILSLKVFLQFWGPFVFGEAWNRFELAKARCLRVLVFEVVKEFDVYLRGFDAFLRISYVFLRVLNEKIIVHCFCRFSAQNN
jgi:hypothetical protein